MNVNKVSQGRTEPLNPVVDAPETHVTSDTQTGSQPHARVTGKATARGSRVRGGSRSKRSLAAPPPQGERPDGFERARLRLKRGEQQRDTEASAHASLSNGAPVSNALVAERCVATSKEIERTVQEMRQDLADLPEPLRRTLEREVFEPVRRIVGMLSREESGELSPDVVRETEEPSHNGSSDRSDSRPSSTAQDDVDDGRILVAGGWETELVEPFEGTLVEGGLFTSRGPNERQHGVEYKPYNEDGAVIGEIRRRGHARALAFAGVADQAGGMGHLTGPNGQPWVGGASAIAVASLAAAADEVHQGADPESALRAAVRAAHEEIAANNVQAGTTLAGALIFGREAHVISLGDSEIWHFDRNGHLKNRSETDSVEDRLVQSSLAAIQEEIEGDGVQLSDEERHRMYVAAVNSGLTVAHILDACIGGTTFVEPHYAIWPLERGDYLVFGTDGLGDSNLQAQKKAVVEERPWTTHHSQITAARIGDVIAAAKSAPAATRDLKEYALDQMSILDPAEYGRAIRRYCAAEEKLGELSLREQSAKAPSSRLQRALVRAQTRLFEAGSHIELASGDGKPDNLAIVTLRIR